MGVLGIQFSYFLTDLLLQPSSFPLKEQSPMGPDPWWIREPESPLGASRQRPVSLPFAFHSLLPPLQTLSTTCSEQERSLLPTGCLCFPWLLGRRVSEDKTCKRFEAWKLLLFSPYAMQIHCPRLEATT